MDCDSSFPCSQPVPLLRRINQVHTLRLWIFKIHFNIVEGTESGGNEPRGLRAPLVLSKYAEPRFAKRTRRNSVTSPARVSQTFWTILETDRLTGRIDGVRTLSVIFRTGDTVKSECVRKSKFPPPPVLQSNLAEWKLVTRRQNWYQDDK
jgi:hypothetical protein